MGNIDDPNMMNQKPNQIEVGYFSKRRQQFNDEVEKGLKKHATVVKPKKAKKKKD